LLQVLSPDFKRLKRTIFDQPEGNDFDRGEVILRFLNISPSAKMRPQDYLSHTQMNFLRDVFRIDTTL